MKEVIKQYHEALHAMQSGVQYDQETGSNCGSPKHLRVGVNVAMSDHGGLVTLLIEKGVFTEDEYLEAIRDSMVREKERYEGLLSKKFDKNIKLH